MKKITAAKITAGMKLDTNAGPAEVLSANRSQGGMFTARDQIIITFKIRSIERELVMNPGQTINVLA